MGEGGRISPGNITVVHRVRSLTRSRSSAVGKCSAMNAAAEACTVRGIAFHLLRPLPFPVLLPRPVFPGEPLRPFFFLFRCLLIFFSARLLVFDLDGDDRPLDPIEDPRDVAGCPLPVDLPLDFTTLPVLAVPSPVPECLFDRRDCAPAVVGCRPLFGSTFCAEGGLPPLTLA